VRLYLLQIPISLRNDPKIQDLFSREETVQEGDPRIKSRKKSRRERAEWWHNRERD
jgi:hypothetical protein